MSFRKAHHLLIKIFLVLLSPVILYSQTLRINEFMAKNDSAFADGFGDFSDWIELFNASAEDINLGGWSLSDDSTNLQKWFLPVEILAAGEYRIIFASGKDTATGSEIHTNFKLSADGEFLALCAPDSSVAVEFRPSFPPQQSNRSFAWFNDDYLETVTPTPGAENILTENPYIEPPWFSHQHGFYYQPFFLKINVSASEQDIYYTTDGSEPSAFQGYLYGDSIEISTTTVLRAVAVRGDSSSNISTATFLFPDSVINQPNNPAGYPAAWGEYVEYEGNAIGDYEMDPEITHDAQWADDMDEALLALPTLSIVTKPGYLFSHALDADTGGIYIYTGDADDNPDGYPGSGWERPASVEYFAGDGSQSFQTDCGLRIHGGHSRRPEKTPKHSFRLVFRSEYGASKLKFPLFEGATAVQSFNTLVLRAGYGNSILHRSASERAKFQLIRDLWAKQTMHDMGYISGHVAYVHLYLNGMYWGIYNPTERLDKEFAQSYYGGNEDDFDIIKDYTEVVDGNNTAWNQLLSIVNSGLFEEENYQRLSGNNPDGTRNPEYPVYLDITNFIDYMLINYYGTNWDWDGHNWAAIRDRANPDKGFQFFSWDAEHLVEDINANNLDLNNSGRPSAIFQALIQNNSFKQLFTDRVQLHFFNDGALSPGKNIERWMKFAGQLDPAIIAETARWGDYRRDVHPDYPGGPFQLYDKQTWLTQLDFIINEYFLQRRDVFITQLQNIGLFPVVTAPTFYINGQTLSGNIVEAGDTLTMSAPAGDIYYTINGQDVIVNDNNIEPEEFILIPENMNKWIWVPTQSVNRDWRTRYDFDETGWDLVTGAPGAIGYDNDNDYQPWISFNIAQDMANNNSCFLRIKFDVDSLSFAQLTTLALKVLYDDGFAAYLNGYLVASNNADDNLGWNSSATAGHEATGFETFNITEFINRLQPGENLLAIHALNNSTTSSDFIINAQLNASNALISGSLAPYAKRYEGPLVLKNSTWLKARTSFDMKWSALSNRLFTIPSEIFDLTVSEIHYHPLVEDTTQDDRLYEFIELKNRGMGLLDLNGVHFSNGISYQFSGESIVQPGAYIVLASDQEKFEERYGFAPFAEFGGNLDNSGERIVLRTAGQDTIFNIRYNDKAPWPESADGAGYSIVQIYPDSSLDINDAAYWRASARIHGSPGTADIIVDIIQTDNITKPASYSLSQNYPNPFNPNTVISYQLPINSAVRLTIYDVLGRKIKTLVNKNQQAGKYQVVFDAAELVSGVYFYKLETNHFSHVKKMLLLK